MIHWPRHLNAEQRKLLQRELQGFFSPGRHYFSSSGTTGRPKWIEHSDETLQASARALIQKLGLTSADVFFRVLPSEHVGGYQVLNRSKLLKAPCVELDVWDESKAYDLAVQKNVTFVSLVPTQLFDWVSSGRKSPHSLRCCLVGAAALDPRLKKQGLDLGFPIWESWGMTEMGSAFALRGPFDDVFSLLPQVEAQLGQDSELQVRGPMRCWSRIEWHGHWRKCDLKDQDFVMTGDRVAESPAGWTWLGRVDDVVKILGVAVDKRLVEQRWQEHFKSRVQVISQPQARRGQELVLVVGSDLDLADIKAFNAQQPGPERVSTLVQVDWNEVTTSLGKLRPDLVFQKFSGRALDDDSSAN